MDEEELLEPVKALDRLIKRTAQRDMEAFSELYQRTKPAVYALALSMTGSAQDAEELTHDAYLKIWDNARSYRSQGSPMAWVLTVARNLCLMSLRRRRRVGELSEEEWDAIPADANSVTPEDRQVLQEALGTLDPQARRIVLLHAVSGLKHRQIAVLLELPLGTVLSKYRRAITKLQENLKGE